VPELIRSPAHACFLYFALAKIKEAVHAPIIPTFSQADTASSLSGDGLRACAIFEPSPKDGLAPVYARASHRLTPEGSLARVRKFPKQTSAQTPISDWSNR